MLFTLSKMFVKVLDKFVMPRRLVAKMKKELEQGMIMIVDPWWGISQTEETMNFELGLDKKRALCYGEFGRVNQPDGSSYVIPVPSEGRPDKLPEGLFFRPAASMAFIVIRARYITDQDIKQWGSVEMSILDAGGFFFLLLKPDNGEWNSIPCHARQNDREDISYLHRYVMGRHTDFGLPLTTAFVDTASNEMFWRDMGSQNAEENSLMQFYKTLDGILHKEWNTHKTLLDYEAQIREYYARYPRNADMAQAAQYHFKIVKRDWMKLSIKRNPDMPAIN